MTVGDRNCQRIGGIGLRVRGELQQGTHHVLHLAFLRATNPHHRLLDLSCRVFNPGSRVTGYGVIRQVGRQLTYLGSGCIRTKVEDLPSRLKLIYAGVTEIITQFQRDA